MRPPALLFVDDELNILRAMARHLRKVSWETWYAQDAAAALNTLRERPIDVVITDYDMPGANGVELLERIAAEFPSTIRLMITGRPDDRVAQYAVDRGLLQGYLEKPWTADELLELLRSAVQQSLRRATPAATSVR